MSHSFGPPNSSQNNFLNKKRLENDTPIENRYHYPKYSKYDRYPSHQRYNNLNYTHSKPPQTNNYYNNRYRNSNYYNSQKSYSRDFRKPYKKYWNHNTNENIRNLSNCDMTPSPPPLSTRYDSNHKSNESNSNGISSLNIDKFVSNISGQNIDIDIKLNTSNKIEEAKYEEEEELPSFKFLRPNEKVSNFEQPFDRKLITIEPNPLDNYDLYPENLFGTEKNNISNGPSSNNYINNIENNIKLKPCYLLAKIPNWRLVTNFVPASALNKERFSNILNLDESKEGDWVPGQKTSLVFNEKYEETVDKFLEQNKSKKKQLNMEFDNMKYIIFQYHYDILKIKNKINQNQFKINCLNVKMNNCQDAIEHKIK